MVLPQLAFKQIHKNITVAAHLDRFVLGSRRDDDSYGNSDEIAARVTLSLAILQAHAEKGLPIDSPRLNGTVSWLRCQEISSSDVMDAPSRLMAAAVLKTPEANVQTDIAGTLGTLTDLNNKKAVEKPVLLLLCLETLNAYGRGPENEQACLGALNRVSEIAGAQTEDPSVLAYACAMLLRLGTHDQKRSATNTIEELIAQQDHGAWADCLVETGYVTLNLASLSASNSEIDDAIFRAFEFMQRNCPGGVPDIRRIKKVPGELGNDPKDRQTYAGAVALRALLQRPNPRVEACLQFAHAAWKLQVESLEADVERERRTRETELTAEKAKWEFQVESLQADCERERRTRETEFKADKAKQKNTMRDVAIAAGISVLLLVAFVAMNPSKSTVALGALGSIAGIYACVRGWIKR